ncbi:hypothetical protein BOTBODRAFT_178313 [Botryobasidium botryosum FD-172 SS1]|uniref:HAT C-terminal dimerisation domain-containing protein n=1 Tax=Botryobasidium botryosum (strain FD-172 SS1) TaxID=930990 RepID=A0A067M3G1_BOTB1|nr:hypothetical protein BOTBODRAFT_178313 [Botryobasidium botryosum FD-172 SS1]
MALDYLTIPATSVDSIQASIVFGNQCKEGLINDDKLIMLLRDKGSHTGRPRRREREERVRVRARDSRLDTGDEEEDEEDGDTDLGMDDLDGDWDIID